MGGETRQSPTPAASGIQPRRIPRIEHWRTPLLDAIFSGLLEHFPAKWEPVRRRKCGH